MAESHSTPDPDTREHRLRMVVQQASIEDGVCTCEPRPEGRPCRNNERWEIDRSSWTGRVRVCTNSLSRYNPSEYCHECRRNGKALDTGGIGPDHDGHICAEHPDRRRSNDE
jgi:hypothetical protein